MEIKEERGLKRAPSAPAAGWLGRTGRTFPSRVPRARSLPGAGLEGDSHRRNLCCECRFLGPAGPFPRAPGPWSDDWACKLPPEAPGQNLHPWQPSERCAWWWVREAWRALGGKRLWDLGMQAVGGGGVGEEVRLGLLLSRQGFKRRAELTGFEAASLESRVSFLAVSLGSITF